MIQQEEIQEILNDIKEFAEDCGFTAFLIKRGKDVAIDSLIIQVTEDEDARVLICNLIPLPEERAKFTEYLHCYMEIPFNLIGMERSDILLCVNEMNRYTALGHFLYIDDETEPKVVLRASIPFSADQGADVSAIIESIFLLREYDDSMEYILARLKGGEDAKDIIGKIEYIHR